MGENNTLPSIMGFNKTSEAGFNIFAPSIFLFGCNMRCPFCMNGRIVVVKTEDWDKPVKKVSIETIEKYIDEEKPEWMMISGGEPTITPFKKLNALLDWLLSKNLKIGMSTNGTYPDILEKIIDKLSYVAMDIKGNEITYSTLDIKNKENSYNKMIKSLTLLEEKKGDNFTYEVRTTLYPLYTDQKVLDGIYEFLPENSIWVWQQYRHTKNMLIPEEALQVEPFSFEQIENFKSKIPNDKNIEIVIRYV
jgi:pyruvate formate lyase activating enzyme